MIEEEEGEVDGAKYMVPSSDLERYARMTTCL